MYLQSGNNIRKGDPITAAALSDIAGVAPDDVIDKLMEAWKSKDFNRVDNTIKEVMRQGYSVSQLIMQLHDKLIDDIDLTERQKSLMALTMAQVDKALVDGADEHLQLLRMFVDKF
ncbi:replication factor C subunit 4 [Irineochytrium annulatum]|nr:replication factor C subunit 4 [Irineochytrium annulatum]